MIEAVNEPAIQKIKILLDQAKALGISEDSMLMQNVTDKFDHLQKNLSQRNDLIKVALVGGFSEGKTSIIAAWLGKMDKERMDISQAESSDSIAKFQLDPKTELIDTPGLFGFKEKKNSSTQEEIQKYKDITKREVSQANLLLYIMNPKVPIANGQIEELKWLFRDLKILPRTVFVLSRFDQVTVLNNEKRCQHDFNIKKDAILKRLRDAIALTPEEEKYLSIVAVSANPFGCGWDYWHESNHLEEFKKLSHIENLQKATQAKIDQQGGADKLKDETNITIIRDIFCILNEPAEKRIIMQEKISGDLLKRAETQKFTLNNREKRAYDIQTYLKNWITDYFNDLIEHTRQETMIGFKDFINNNIGKNGEKIQEK